MISSGQLSEVDEIIQLTKACAKNLREQGIDQWDENYPAKSIIENDILSGTLFTFKVENEILGIIVLNETQDDEYQELNWLTSALHRSIVVHRLAVKPKHQGKGIAQKLMAFGEEHAWKNDYNSIRLDTFSQNPRNQQFYLKRNYKFIGEVFLKYKKDFSYFCYELMNPYQ